MSSVFLTKQDTKAVGSNGSMGFISLCHEIFLMAEQISARNDHNAAFCDEELRFGIVMEEAMKCKTAYRAKYHRS